MPRTERQPRRLPDFDRDNALEEQARVDHHDDRNRKAYRLCSERYGARPFRQHENGVGKGDYQEDGEQRQGEGADGDQAARRIKEQEEECFGAS